MPPRSMPCIAARPRCPRAPSSHSELRHGEPKRLESRLGRARAERPHVGLEQLATIVIPGVEARSIVVDPAPPDTQHAAWLDKQVRRERQPLAQRPQAT